MALGTIRIQSPGGGTTYGSIGVTGGGLSFLTPVYRYANLTLPFSPNDPGLQFNYDNSTLAPVVQLYARFFNLLNEPSTGVQFNAGTTALQVTSAAVSGADNSDCLNVVNFGAVGDGVTDDTAACQKALDQAEANFLASAGPQSAGYPGTRTAFPHTLLNGWGPNAHVGLYEGGFNQGLQFGLDGGSTVGFQNPGNAFDGNDQTLSTAAGQHTHTYYGCVWAFNAISITGNQVYLNMLTEVPVNGQYGLIVNYRSSALYYSLDGGNTWILVYNRSGRVKTWDSIKLPVGQDYSLVQVMAFVDSHDDMAMNVFELNISQVTANSGKAPTAVCFPSGYTFLVNTQIRLDRNLTQPPITYRTYPISYGPCGALGIGTGVNVRVYGTIRLGPAFNVVTTIVTPQTNILFIFYNKNAFVNGPQQQRLGPGSILINANDPATIFANSETGPRNSNITITGTGILDCGYLGTNGILAQNYPANSAKFFPNVYSGAICLCKCDNSTISGLTIINSIDHALELSHSTGLTCKNMVLDGTGCMFIVSLRNSTIANNEIKNCWGGGLLVISGFGGVPEFEPGLICIQFSNNLQCVGNNIHDNQYSGEGFGIYCAPNFDPYWGWAYSPDKIFIQSNILIQSNTIQNNSRMGNVSASLALTFGAIVLDAVQADHASGGVPAATGNLGNLGINVNANTIQSNDATGIYIKHGHVGLSISNNTITNNTQWGIFEQQIGANLSLPPNQNIQYAFNSISGNALGQYSPSTDNSGTTNLTPTISGSNFTYGGTQQPVYNTATNEVPSGLKNGSNTIFTLAHTPVAQAPFSLYLNGLLQTQGTDYTRSGVTITMTVAPSSGATLTATYGF